MAEIFITRRIFRDAIDILKRERHTIDINDSDRILPVRELVKRAHGKAGLICLLNDRIDSVVMDELESLKVISNIAVGYDNIDIAAATQRGIMVTNTPGVLTETTADLAFALLLSAARRIPEADQFIRAGKFKNWQLMQPQMGVDIYEKTLGIVGMGAIGQAVAKRARKGFDMRVIYRSLSRKETAEKEYEAEFVEFDELLAMSDFISIHVPLTEKTKHMFTAQEFKKMKNTAILINTARGPVVDEAALVEAIKDGQIRGAALDVFEEEPSVHPELIKMEENVVLAPHIGSASIETRLRMAKMAARNMAKGLKGTRPPNLVNEKVTYKKETET
ncbi:MAG: D-glycerate dehydrogenase [Desulfobacteraceae bacterium]|nr:D-glycerate dehydrogenase [Desulfobacteraceae bacterium]MDH3721529.1 D-glycerate dehydrogenase [Desulfobacteraceae bacterium]MDH3839091.1 D-glycerate dehydrogenase [Desulfobacteraceae bacterium]MDH3873486.1 D-glycerate dehydrogenase [Desulfobacteraceae bacterium]MDH3880874.1 D-glycerate dehydrogenase [Desulfobacteraceae bacterium]